MFNKPTEMNFIIPLVVYPFDLMVSFGETDEVLSGKLIELGIDTEKNREFWSYPDGICEGRCAMFDTGQSLLRLRKVPESVVDLARVQHEVFHFVSFLMYRLGMPLEINVSCEAYAYLTEYVTLEIYKKINVKLFVMKDLVEFLEFAFDVLKVVILLAILLGVSNFVYG